MDAEFDEVKRAVESEDDQPLEPAEEVQLKALYYFAKGCKLKAQLEARPTSVPERIGEVCKRVLEDIRQRMERVRKQRHRAGVFAATRDFLSGKSSRTKRGAGRKRRMTIGR